jgi:alcohol dehydrogenase class IV
MMQRIEIVEDSFSVVSDMIKTKKAANILLITGYHFDKDRVQQLNISSGQVLHHYIPVQALLNFEKIQADINGFPEKPDILVAVGGGRILDAAKLVIRCLANEKPYFIAIPTTAGSGSEATPFAVVYKDKEKYSVEDSTMLPDYVLLDANMISALSSKQRAISGIDALAQSVESTWNKNATEFSITKSTKALRLVYNNIVEFVNTKNFERDQTMLRAAYMAGEAIAVTRTTGCHALSYYLTAQHEVPHGQAVGFFLPAFFIYNDRPEVRDKLHIIYGVLNVRNASEAFDGIASLMKNCGLATRFSEMNLQVDIDKLVHSVNQQRFSNNPVAFDSDRLKELINQYIV